MPPGGHLIVFELLGRRWALRVLWELREQRSFRQLCTACEKISPSVLSQRLTELRQLGLVSLGGYRGYQLTKTGRQLLRTLGPMATWADAWWKKK